MSACFELLMLQKKVTVYEMVTLSIESYRHSDKKMPE